MPHSAVDKILAAGLQSNPESKAYARKVAVPTKANSDGSKESDGVRQELRRADENPEAYPSDEDAAVRSRKQAKQAGGGEKQHPQLPPPPRGWEVGIIGVELTQGDHKVYPEDDTEDQLRYRLAGQAGILVARLGTHVGAVGCAQCREKDEKGTSGQNSTPNVCNRVKNLDLDGLLYVGVANLQIDKVEKASARVDILQPLILCLFAPTLRSIGTILFPEIQQGTRCNILLHLLHGEGHHRRMGRVDGRKGQANSGKNRPHQPNDEQHQGEGVVEQVHLVHRECICLRISLESDKGEIADGLVCDHTPRWEFVTPQQRVQEPVVASEVDSVSARVSVFRHRTPGRLQVCVEPSPIE
mmetsp:Transcript_15571/g.36053  ORF Transcript_15571/g.36053 Transcript_15571/m.36053 type:complete len:356 (+) Transcript_15571:1147-2214(+)